MEIQNCAICGKKMNLVPAGISKRTGKDYEAFYSCPSRCIQPKGLNTFGNSGISLDEIDKKLDRILGLLGENTKTRKTNEALETINTEDIPF